MRKLFWINTARKNCLSARVRVGPRGFEIGINESDIDPIQEWCEEHHCGTRISFDTFKFKSKKEITMFLLKWG